MKFSELPQVIKEKLIIMHNLDSSPSNYVSLVMKDNKVKPAFYNVNEESHMDFLETDYLNEYDAEGYRAKMDAKYGKREDRMFERAEKIPASKYDGMVYWGEEYYYGVSDFIDNFIENFDFDGFATEEEAEHYESAPENKKWSVHEEIAKKYLPKFVWGTKSYKPREIDVDDIVDKMFGEAQEWEEFDYDIKGLKEFGDALESFKKQNQVTKYFVEDNTKAILLNK